MKMRALHIALLSSALMMGACAGTGTLSSGAVQDDLYYSRSTKLSTASTAGSVQSEVSAEDMASYGSRVSNYNYATADDSHDFSAYENKTLLASSDEVDAEVAEDDGYWDGGFYGSDSDQSYAERLVKFYGPYPASSYYNTPFYVVARSSGDWNIYVENGYAYYVPTWSNPYYYDFYYGVGWNWRRHNWYWNYGWGYYDPWYSWYWGWDYPYYYGYYGHYWHHNYAWHHNVH